MWWRKKDKVEKLIAKLAFWKPEAVRKKAIRELGAIGDARAVEPLIKVLSSWSENLRNEAIEALGKIGAPAAVVPLVRTLQEPFAPTSQHEIVAKALVRIGPPAVRPLIKAFTNDEWLMRVRRAGAGTFYNSAPEVQGDCSILVSTELAVKALGKIGNIRVVKPLIKMLSELGGTVCETVVEVLGNMGDPRAVEPLIKVLEGWDVEIRRVAAEALGKLGDVRAVEPLIEALGTHAPDVCENAATALVKIGSQAVEPLIKALMHEDADVRVQVASILERIGWTPGNDVERTNFFTAKGKIEAVLFGQKKPRRFDENRMIVNPDITELTIPIAKLKWIGIHAETYDFHLVERFITYAVNYIGQKYLKNNVEVHIHGDPNKLHPNLRNSLENLCKCVVVNRVVA